MSPRQAIVITVSATYDNYAQDVSICFHCQSFILDLLKYFQVNYEIINCSTAWHKSLDTYLAAGGVTDSLVQTSRNNLTCLFFH